MNKVIFDITAEDIQLGEQGNCRSCPIARRAEIVLGTPVAVSNTELRVYETGAIYTLPAKAATFVDAFDIFSAEAVKPIQFELDLDAPVRYGKAYPKEVVQNVPSEEEGMDPLP